jgi:rSAM/selenodomain-associated transferase 2
MISVVIPTLNAAGGLTRTLRSLAPAGDLVAEVIVSDGGSADETAAIAGAGGARVIVGAKGRGGQLARGAAAARGEHFLFLHADTALEADWPAAAAAFIRAGGARAGVFRLAFDDPSPAARIVAAAANIRTRIFALPYGDQGLLVSRAVYDSVGGYRDMPLFEDVDIIDRLRATGCAIQLMKSRAVTSAARYRARGWLAQVFANQRAIADYRRGVSVDEIATRYEAARRGAGE